ACGDPKAAFKVAILDPELTLTLPRHVTAIAGYDALSHAVESYVTTKRTMVSDLFARDAWRLLEAHYAGVLATAAALAAGQALRGRAGCPARCASWARRAIICRTSPRTRRRSGPARSTRAPSTPALHSPSTKTRTNGMQGCVTNG